MSTPSIRSKFPNMGMNIFTAMNAVATEQNAINLAQGFPNFPCSEKLISLVDQYMRKGFNQYCPMPGALALREAIVEKIQFIYGKSYSPDTEINVTPGGHAALMAAVTSVIHPGDEVIIFEPAFDCFAPIVELNGGVPVYIELRPPAYKIPWQEVALKISDKTKAIIINSPHNPSGTVLEESDMRSLIDLVKNTNIVIISDEVYEHLIFDGFQHQSVMRYPELAERSFSIYSFGKVYHVTGWKIGYVVAPKELMAEFRKCYQMMTFTVNHPMQLAIAEFLKEKDEYLNLPDFYQKKRDFFLNGIKNSRFEFTPAKGTYFQSLSYGKIMNAGDMDAAIWFAKNAKVGTVPMSALYHNNAEHKVLRVCFAKTEEVLEQAAVRLSRI
ncbi:MAG: methionine aminotransferase [bacterium]|nr:methionine aminotransferase [bacterium]